MARIKRAAADDAIELAAWRFLARHRVGGLKASHVQFIDSAECRINTPSCGRFYESAGGATFGEAAIKLAIALGMPCETPACNSDIEAGKSSAATAPRPNGASVKSSRRTRPERVGSTTDATGADPPTGAPGGQPKRRPVRKKSKPPDDFG